MKILRILLVCVVVIIAAVAGARYVILGRIQSCSGNFPYRAEQIDKNYDLSEKIIYRTLTSVCVSGLDGKTPRTVLDHGYPEKTFLFFDSKGRKVYYTEKKSTYTITVFEQTVGESSSREIFSFSPYRSYSPEVLLSVLSEDGQKYAVYRGSAGLSIYSFEDGTTKTLFNDGCSDSDPVTCNFYSPLLWSDDGHMLLVARWSGDENKKSQLILIDPFQNKITPIVFPSYPSNFYQNLQVIPGNKGFIVWSDDVLAVYDAATRTTKTYPKPEWKDRELTINNVSSDGTRAVLEIATKYGNQSVSAQTTIEKELVVLNIATGGTNSILKKAIPLKVDYMGDVRETLSFETLWAPDSQHLYISTQHRYALVRDRDEVVVLDTAILEEEKTSMNVRSFVGITE